MRPCEAQRSAQEEQPPEPREEERPEERGERSSRPRQDIGAGKNEKRAQRYKNWSEMVEMMMQQMATTSCNAEDADSSIRRSCPSAGAWRQAARLSLE